MPGSDNEPTRRKSTRAPATEATLLCGALLAAHVATLLLAGRGFGLLSEGYFALVVVILPLLTGALTFSLVQTHRWQVAHALASMAASLLLSFLHFLIIGAASASV